MWKMDLWLDQIHGKEVTAETDRGSTQVLLIVDRKSNEKFARQAVNPIARELYFFLELSQRVKADQFRHETGDPSTRSQQSSAANCRPAIRSATSKARSRVV